MTRAMDSVQAERAGRSNIAPLALIKITTYSDRTAGIVEKELYFSDKAVEYDYGNTGTDQWFLPIVAGGSEFFSGFIHIPLPDDLTAFGKTFDLVCSNLKINGRRPVATLRDYNIEGAEVEVAQMLLSKAEMDALSDKNFLDLTAYDGDEHTVLFRGRVNRIFPVTDTSLTITCTQDLPSLPGFWNYAADATKTAPQDVGKRLPRVYGEAKRVACVNYSVGYLTTLAEPIDDSETGSGYQISDGSGLPTVGAFFLRVDSEIITCAYETDTTITISTRGQASTTPAAHNAGVLMSALLPTTSIIVSDRQSDALNHLYILNPVSGVLERLNYADTPWTTDLADTGLIAGQVVTSVTFSDTELIDLLNYLQIGTVTGVPAYGLRFFADVDGIESPGVDVETWGDGESFDSGSWSVSGCTVAVDTSDKLEGTGSQKLTVDVDTLAGAEVITTEDTTDWTGITNCGVSRVTDADHREGTYAIKVSSADPGTGSINCIADFYDAGLGINLTDTGGGRGLVAFDFKYESEHESRFNGMIIRLGDSSGGWDHVYKMVYLDLVLGEWHTIIVDYENGYRPSDWDPTDWCGLEFSYGARWGTVDLFIDNIKVFRDVPRTIQHSGVGGVDFTGVGSQYRLSGKRGTELLESDVAVFISDESPAGTTMPTEYRELQFLPSWNPESWTTLRSTGYSDTGTPDLSDVNTARVELNIVGIAGIGQENAGIYFRDPIFNFNVDDLKFSASVGTAYYASYGDLMSHPADIMRHWIAEVGGETVDLDSYADLYTSLLASAKWGFDARSLGFAWEEVLQRMAFEARSNVVAVEASGGREWKMLSAGGSYGFGIPPDSAVITQTHALSDIGRSADEIASMFTFQYAYNAADDWFTRAIEVNSVYSGVEILASRVLTAAHRFGYHDMGPITFRCIQDIPTANDVAGYIVQERIENERRVFDIPDVAWFDALPYNIGDLVRITPPWLEIGDEYQILDCEDHASDFISAHSLDDVASPKYEGTYSMGHLIDINATNSIAGTAVDAIGTQNLVDRSIVVRCYINPELLSYLNNVRLRVSSAVGGASNWAEWAYYADALVGDEWMRLEFPIRLRHARTTGGSVDLRNIVNLWLRFQTNSAAPAGVPDRTLYWDDVRVEHQSVPCRITAMSKAFESNSWNITVVEIPEYGLRNV